VANFNIRINFVKVREYSHGIKYTKINVRDYIKPFLTKIEKLCCL